MNIWNWAWSIPILKKKNISIIKKILNYGMDLESDSHNIFVKKELITSKFEISNPVQIDIHLSIVSYLSKLPFIFNYTEYFIENISNKQKEHYIPINNKKKNDDWVVYLFILDLPNEF